MSTLFQVNGLDLLGFVWLLVCWLGYTYVAKKRAKQVHCIASALHYYRRQWMFAMLERDNRIADASLLTNLERNASFLASTAILAIAGLVTTLASIDKVHQMLLSVPWSHGELSPTQLQFKIMLLLMIFIYAFFTFTWSMRQYGFCAVLVGAAPQYSGEQLSSETAIQFAKNSAKIIDQAGHSYNYGLRAYYFSLSVIAWLLNTWLFILAVAVVVAILYGREFHSKTLNSLIQVSDIGRG